jgi:hypothetical protein
MTDTIRHTFTSGVGITGLIANLKTNGESEVKVFWCDKSELEEPIILADENHNMK